MVVAMAASVPAPRVKGLSKFSPMPASSRREASPMRPLPVPNASE